MKHLEERIWIRQHNGRRTYTYRRRIFDNRIGKMRDIRVALGPNLKRAQVKAHRLDADIAAQQRGEAPRQDVTLGVAVAQYIKHIRDERKLLGWKTVASNLGLFVREISDRRILGTITRLEIEQFLQTRARQVRAMTVNTYLKDLKRLMTWAEDRKLVDEKPTQRIKPIPAKRLTIPLPSSEDLGRLLVHLKARGSWLYEYVVFSVATGARLSEVLRLDWNGVDIAHSRLILQRSKTADELAFDLVGTLKDVMWSLWTAQGMPAKGLVFGMADGRQRNGTVVKEVLRCQARRFNLGWISPRHFRRLAAQTTAERDGILAASALLGHASVSTTQNYLGRNEEARRRGVDATASFLSELVPATAQGPELGAAEGRKVSAGTPAGHMPLEPEVRTVATGANRTTGLDETK